VGLQAGKHKRPTEGAPLGEASWPASKSTVLGLFGVSLDYRNEIWRIAKIRESHLGRLLLSRAFFEGGERLLSL